MYKLPNTLDEDIRYIDTLIKDFNSGKISAGELKAIRVPMGIYEQRTNGTYMLRIRCSGGFILPSQLRQVAETATHFNASHIHITSRQEVQIHHLKIEDAVPAINELKSVELGTKGGGGNTVRNMLVDIRSGISDKEVFDTYPYVSDLTTFLIAQKDSFTLPRKLKIAFALSESEPNYALINDLGFIPIIKEGKRGFKVYLGGSVASNPHLGWNIFDYLPEEDLFRVVIATKRFFSANGNRKNRHKARIRYIFYKLGEEDTKNLFYTYFEETKSDASLTYIPSKPTLYEHLQPSFPPETNGKLPFKLWKARYTEVQKTNDFFSVFVPFLHGNAPATVFLAIAHFAEAFGEDTLRFTTRQSLQIRNIPEAYLPNLYTLLKELQFDIDNPLLLNNITSCTGADTCRLGICFSKGLQEAIRERLVKSNLPLDELDGLLINISGCTNSCDQQIWADLGFSGRIFRFADHAAPAYTVYARTEGNFTLGQPLGAISAHDVPLFVEEVLHDYLKKKDLYNKFTEYTSNEGKGFIVQRLKELHDIPSFEEDKNYYFDWGAKEIFSLTSHGKAECSAGLFDMIDIDKAYIEDNRTKLSKAKNNTEREKYLYDIVFSASRMLLITRGVEPRNEEEVFKQFSELFITQKLVDAKFQKVIDAASKKDPLDALEQDILELGDAIIALYGTIDDSLQFKLPTQNTNSPIVEKTDIQETGKGSPITVKDFRGVVCPINFVKTKIALAPLKSGDLLEVWIDDGQPIENVPGSVRNEGHEILSTLQVDDYWKVLIKKK